MFCPRCGNKLHPGSTVCAYCNYELDPEDIIDVTVTENKSEKLNLKHNKKDKIQSDNHKQTTRKSRSYLLLYFIYIMIFLPIVGVIAAFLSFGVNIYSFASLIIGLLIEAIVIYYIWTLKH